METSKRSSKIQISKLLGAIKIKRIIKTYQTPLVETAQTKSRTRHEVRKLVSDIPSYKSLNKLIVI